VTLLYGCSLTFERSLVAAGISLPHWEQQSAVPMYDTNVVCAPAGRLHGNLVVSMRPIPARMVPIAVEVTARMPYAHGAPVQVGHPESLGIRDLSHPDYGDPVPDGADLLPTFWACGVTLQAVLRTAKLPFAITHYPGHMFITDLSDGSSRRPLDGHPQQDNRAQGVLL
jgi:uncharacterized protein YcsI (UPF0317 family)